MPIRQSVVLPMMHNMKEPVDELLGEIRAIGFEAVEFWGLPGDYETIFEKVRKAGLVIASICGHGTIAEGLNKRQNHDRIEQELRASIDTAAQYQVPGVIAFSGNRNTGQSDYEGITICAEGLKRIAPYAEERGVNVNLELLNSRVDHPNYQADRSDWGVAVCEMVGSERVKLLFDIYHMQIMEGDIIRTIRKMVRHIGHFHTAGNPGRNDLDDEQELNYRGICRAIATSGFVLFVGHELKPKGSLLQALRSTYEVCNVRP